MRTLFEISLDVISLFTNIPIDLALDSIYNRWSAISKICNISKEEFFISLQLVFILRFFFDNIIYRQKFEMPMGSPLSPVFADLILQDLEKKALNILAFHIPFYVRYVE